MKQEHEEVNRRENTNKKIKQSFGNALKGKYYISLAQNYFVYNFTIIT